MNIPSPAALGAVVLVLGLVGAVESARGTDAALASEAADRTAILDHIRSIFQAYLMMCATPGDVLIALSVSKQSPNIILACQYWQERGDVIGLWGRRWPQGADKFADVAKARESLTRLLKYNFDTVLVGDGTSILGGGKEAVRRAVEA